jgi:hypothetical protein
MAGDDAEHCVRMVENCVPKRKGGRRFPSVCTMFGRVEHSVLKGKGGMAMPERNPSVQCLKTACSMRKSGCDDRAPFGAIGHGDLKRNWSGGGQLAGV